MILALLAFLGGTLTIISPCTLPVLPFVFAKSDRPFARSTLPLLVGMAVTFSAVATLAAVGGGWAVRLNSVGRAFALLLLGLFGVALLSKRVAEWLARPAVALGNRLLESGSTGGAADAMQSLLLGIATGLLWAPCAGPILGLILTGAAIHGPNTGTTLLLLAYALGAAVSIAVVTLAGRGVYGALRRSLAVSDSLRRGLGVLVLAAVVVIGLGWDTGILTRLSLGSTTRLEQALVSALPQPSHASATAGASPPAMNMMMSAGAHPGAAGSARSPSAAPQLPIEGQLPALTGAIGWINSPPLTPEALRGKVVVVDFWTYSCINCLRTLPYIRAWYQRYHDYGLVILGVHSPEFAFEKEPGNVRRAVHDLGIDYPVAIDSNLAIWQAFGNEYWPADYFIDGMGRIRGHAFGEGDYAASEQLIRQLLTLAGQRELPVPVSPDIRGAGIEAAPDQADIQSPETYIGYQRAANFASTPAIVHDKPVDYHAPSMLQLQVNQWGLSGQWNVGGQVAVLQSLPGTIVFQFHARDLHLVLGPATDGPPIRFRVLLDGRAPGQDHGTDTDAQGYGVVREERLYQLIRQSGEVGSHTFSIEFLAPHVHAYSFTFG
jgi:cytochrome c biogenesis protein CcdA/thiol-disulfide isomerase/thioredoxin